MSECDTRSISAAPSSRSHYGSLQCVTVWMERKCTSSLCTNNIPSFRLIRRWRACVYVWKFLWSYSMPQWSWSPSLWCVYSDRINSIFSWYIETFRKRHTRGVYSKLLSIVIKCPVRQIPLLLTCTTLYHFLGPLSFWSCTPLLSFWSCTRLVFTLVYSPSHFFLLVLFHATDYFTLFLLSLILCCTVSLVSSFVSFPNSSLGIFWYSVTWCKYRLPVEYCQNIMVLGEWL